MLYQHFLPTDSHVFFLNLDIFWSFLSFLHFSTTGRISGCIPFRDPAGATSGPGRYQAGEGPLGISRFFLCPLKAPKTGLTWQDEIPLPRMRGALNVTRRGRARRRSADASTDLVRSRPFWCNPPDIFSDLPSLRCLNSKILRDPQGLIETGPFLVAAILILGWFYDVLSQFAGYFHPILSVLFPHVWAVPTETTH